MKKDDERSGACSNTPPKTVETTSVCIDYFKIRLIGNYDSDRLRFIKLFEILRVYDYEIDKEHGRNAYAVMLKLFPGASLCYGGRNTITKNGEETCLLELSGKGCREFEDRYYSFHPDRGWITRNDVLREGWIKLIEECNRLDGVATRLDIPTDDMSGQITIEEIKNKILHKEYSTRMRKLELTNSNNEEDDDLGFKEPEKLQGINRVSDAKLTGYSATFGNRQHVQLCIYDKAAEQHNKGNFLNIPKWIRYEVRYYHENAERALPLLLEALRKREFHIFVIGRLKGLFEFKESSINQERSKNKVWSKWEQFAAGVEKQSGFSAVPGVPTILSNAAWLKKDAALALGKVISCMDVPLAEISAAYAIEFLHRADNSHLQAINQFRRQAGKEPFESLKQVQFYIYSKQDFPEEIHQETINMILAIGNKPKDDKNESENKNSNEK